MAAADCSIVEMVQTIESGSTETVITKSLTSMTGTLVNGGAVTVWVLVNDTGVAGDDANARGEVALPVGASMPIWPHYLTLAHKTAADAGVLYWFPN